MIFGKFAGWVEVAKPNLQLLINKTPVKPLQKPVAQGL
jgi:hypothetical protein